ncbi:MAG: sigma-70 family RNA polymerase sigma factor [Gemmataceae bacterium]|nr:sigma-70 family RNA polymerase sigma factor [Gemmataceae bacterium]MBY0514579.1 sigma-70 family RNA polymerase sigma factor [Gemmataceae bacterium]
MPGDNTTAIEQAVQFLKAGDPAARAQLVNLACDRLRLLTRKMLRDDFDRLRRWEQTDDVFQNAVLRLHRALSEVTPESARHFLNLAALQVRRELLNLAEHYFGPQGPGANHHTDGQPADDQGGVLRVVASGSAGPQTAAEWSEFHTLVGKLPDDERGLFHLIWYQGLGQDEAAAVLGVSVRTVKRRWQAVKVRLYGLLGGDVPGGGDRADGR